MANQEAPANRSFPDRPFQTGFGRQVDPVWTSDFADTMRRMLPSNIIFGMRILPGLVYGSGYELQTAGLIDYDGGDEDERQVHVQAYADSLVASLCDRGKLDRQTATSGLALPLSVPTKYRLRYDPESRSSTLAINVDDRPSVLKPGEYAIRTEKETFADELHIPSHANSNRTPPKHLVGLGTFQGYVETRTVKRIIDELEEPVPFLRIGVIRTSRIRILRALLSEPFAPTPQDVERMIRQVAGRYPRGPGKPRNRARRN
jgi:hypothetical protein